MGKWYTRFSKRFVSFFLRVPLTSLKKQQIFQLFQRIFSSTNIFLHFFLVCNSFYKDFPLILNFLSALSHLQRFGHDTAIFRIFFLQKYKKCLLVFTCCGWYLGWFEQENRNVFLILLFSPYISTLILLQCPTNSL